MWVAYLNLEHQYGTDKSLLALFKRCERLCSKSLFSLVAYCAKPPDPYAPIHHCARAEKQNDGFKVYLKLIDIYTRAGKKKHALSLCNEATKKFKTRVAVWELYMQMLLRQSRTDEARVALRRALTVLSKNKHVLMMSKFAILEYVARITLQR